MARDTMSEIKEKMSEIERLLAKLGSQQVRHRFYSAQTILLKEGEHYAGIILGKEPGTGHHLILLPHESEAEMNWVNALKWAASVGGELPTRREQSLLYANLKDQFKPTGYWSSEQHADDADYAWMQHFLNGLQYDYPKVNEWRARAVRRLIIQ